VTNDVPSCEQNWLAMVDTSTVNTARVWHYWLGGKDNYPIDEQVSDQIAAAIPQTIDFARAVRGFSTRGDLSGRRRSHHLTGQEFEPLIQLAWSPGTTSACSATPALTVTLSRPQPTTTVCTVTGAVTWNTQPLLSNALTQARRDDNAHLIIDLSAVTFMD
jgi:S-adenosyl methyltransferase